MTNAANAEGQVALPDPKVQPIKPRDAAEEKLMAQALSAYESNKAATAQRLFTRLANQGNAWGMYNLAAMFGQGQDKYPAKATPAVAKKQAAFWLNKAAALNYPQALLVLGQAHENESLTPHVKRDLAKAAEYFHTAAELGQAQAAQEFGAALYLGRGVTKDITEAAKWFLQAARAGESDSQYMVASMYELGDGLPQDDRLAITWYEAAAKQGDVAAKAKAAELIKKN